MVLDDFILICRAHALNFRIDFSEGADQFEILAVGQGMGERFYVKKCKHLEDGFDYIVEQLNDYIITVKLRRDSEPS